MLRRMPFLKLLAVGQTVLLARRHFLQLDDRDRRRLRELVMRGKAMSPAERDELRHLLGQAQPGGLRVRARRRVLAGADPGPPLAPAPPAPLISAPRPARAPQLH